MNNFAKFFEEVVKKPENTVIEILSRTLMVAGCLPIYLN